MHISLSALVLGTVAAGTVSAASITHQSFHGKKHNHAARHAEMIKASISEDVEKRDAAVANKMLTTASASKLSAIGVLTGQNSQAAGSIPWVGTAGNAAFTNEFVNQSGEDLTLVLWGAAGSWVNAVQPQITVSIPQGQNQTVSFPDNWSGAWAPVYGATTQYFGQVIETWGEATFNKYYATADVSREVNGNGRNMKIVTPQCVSDMNTCVFVCNGENNMASGFPQCLHQYKLLNCAIGSQPGANYGKDPNLGNADTGGCSGMGQSAKLTTYLGYN